MIKYSITIPNTVMTNSMGIKHPHPHRGNTSADGTQCSRSHMLAFAEYRIKWHNSLIIRSQIARKYSDFARTLPQLPDINRPPSEKGALTSKTNVLFCC